MNSVSSRTPTIEDIEAALYREDYTEGARLAQQALDARLADESVRTGRPVAELEAEGRAQVMAFLRERWASEPVAAVARG